MANKELTAHAESRDFTARLNLFVQTNPALMSVVIAAILLVATFAINPAGFNLVAVGNILLLTILLSITSAGQTIVLIGGGMDFGVGAVMSATAILTTYTMNGENGHFLQVLVIALAIGAAVGFLNGFCAVKIGLPAMIVTMAIANIVTRMQYVLTQGVLSGSASQAFADSVLFKIGGVIPSIALYAAIIWPLTFFILNRSRYGKQLYLVGNNPVAARLSGVKVNQIKIISYVMSGMLAAFAGMLGAAYMSTARCQIFDDYAYDSLIAVIIGGTAFSGGIGSYEGSIAGSLVMILLSNLLTTLQLTQPIRNVTQGVIMILLLMLYNRSKSVRQ
jgi:ribose transport system permease protein